MSPPPVDLSLFDAESWSNTLYNWFIKDANQKTTETLYSDCAQKVVICLYQRKQLGIDVLKEGVQGNVSNEYFSTDNSLDITLKLLPQYHQIMQCQKTLTALKHMLDSCTDGQRIKIVTISYSLHDIIDNLEYAETQEQSRLNSPSNEDTDMPSIDS